MVRVSRRNDGGFYRFYGINIKSTVYPGEMADPNNTSNNNAANQRRLAARFINNGVAIVGNDVCALNCTPSKISVGATQWIRRVNGWQEVASVRWFQ